MSLHWQEGSYLLYRQGSKDSPSALTSGGTVPLAFHVGTRGVIGSDFLQVCGRVTQGTKNIG